MPRGQSGSLVCTLTKDHSVAETGPTAWGTLQVKGVFYIQWMVRVLAQGGTLSGKVGPVPPAQSLLLCHPQNTTCPRLVPSFICKGQTKPRVQKPWDP